MTEKPDKNQLIHLFNEFNKVSSTLQLEMSRVVVSKPQLAAQLQRQLNGTENQMEEAMNTAAEQFIKILPLAQMNRVNMFCKVLAMHSNLTGNPLMHEVFAEVNQRVFDTNL